MTQAPPTGPDAAARTGAPARADGVELLGAMQGSGYREAPGLVRRADGQTLQLTPLLYALLDEVDGERDATALADAVSARVGRRLRPQDAERLLDRLRPLGVLRADDGSQPQVRKADPLLGLRFRVAVTDPRTTRRVTAPFAVLFTPVVVAVVLVAFVATTGWLLLHKGLASATADAFGTPSLLLLVLVFTVLSAGFHEFGHAAACRYGGATPGAMGAGLYLVWPAFYTEVNDSYRLGRGGRLRVDLGGLYFNALFSVAVVGLWAVVRFDALLLLVVAQVLQMVRQLTPLVRFDGYHVLADLTGVPDLFSRIGPTLRGLLPWNWGRPETRVLRPWARAVVTAWVLVVVPLLVTTLTVTALAFPRVVGTALARLRADSTALGDAWAGGNVAKGFVTLFAMAAVALPLLGVVYVLSRTVRRLVRLALRRTAGRPVARAAVALAGAAVVAALAWAWWPGGDTYRPVTRQERGTLGDVLQRGAPVRALDGAAAGRRLRAGDRVRAPRTVLVAAPGAPRLTEGAPVPAVVLVPRDDPSAPTWVFPFAPPAAPGADDNQAYALNTTDGSTRYVVSFALVQLDGTAVTPRNEAYALASCTACTTVAVAFQVVLVTGDTRLAVPQNVAAAVNAGCVSCLTFALATQLVLQVPAGGLDDTAAARLQALWAAATSDLSSLSLDQLRARVEDLRTQVQQLVAPTPTASPSASPRASATAAATSAPEPVPTTSASSSPTASPQPSRTPTPAAQSATPEPSATP